MKVYIVCDLEGVAGVVDFRKQCLEEGTYYQQAVRVATLELNSLIEGLIEGGATETYAWPGHGYFPGGIDFELIHPECKLIMHAGDAGPVGLDDSFDAMVLHGLHAMAGAPNGVLSHSFTPLPKKIMFNETVVGEIGMNIYTFSESGVPCIMITGDQAAVDEARRLIPNIIGVPVKWGLDEKEKIGALSVRKAISLSPAMARKRIREAAKESLKRLSEFRPIELRKPFTLKVEYIESKYADEKISLPGVSKIDEVTIEKVCKTLDDVLF